MDNLNKLGIKKDFYALLDAFMSLYSRYNIDESEKSEIIHLFEDFKEILKPILKEASFNSRVKESYIVKMKGHKNSKGEISPYSIISHETGKILSSHKTEAEAKKHLKQIKFFKHKKGEEMNTLFSFKGKNTVDELIKESMASFLAIDDGKVSLDSNTEDYFKNVIDELDLFLRNHQLTLGPKEEVLDKLKGMVHPKNEDIKVDEEK